MRATRAESTRRAQERLDLALPPSVTANTFEDFLRAHYVPSRRAQRVAFDLSNVRWMGVLELSLLTIWMLELSDLGTEVTCSLPSDADAFRFLIEYRFHTVVTAKGVLAPKPHDTTASPASAPLGPAPFFPLTFFDQHEFQLILDGLHKTNRLEVLLQAASHARIVKSGVIRDVVISELGDNLFRHADGQYAHIIMTKLTAFESALPRRKTSKHQGFDIEQYEKTYLNKIAGTPYIAIVVADKGPGIPSTLRAAYLSDEVLLPATENPSEANLLSYAFLYHTTRRTLEDRIGALQEFITSTNDNALPPPTGLFRLMSTVREFGGYMHVRCGATILAYDSLRDEPPVTSVRSKGVRKFAAFGGTQFKLFFPVDIPQRYLLRRRHFSLQTRRTGASYFYLLVDDFLPPERTADSHTEAVAVLRILDAVEQRHLSAKGVVGVLIHSVDSTRLSAKAMYYLLIELMRRQSSGWANILANVDDHVLNADATFDAATYRDARPLLVLDKGCRAHLLPAKGNELSSHLRESISKADLRTAKMAEANDHLFRFDDNTDSFQPIHTAADLLRNLREAIQETLTREITAPGTNVHHDGAKVLLPSGLYCLGYFELHRTLDIVRLRTLAQEWIRLAVIESQPTVVISIGTVVASLVEDALRDLSDLAYVPVPTHLKLRTTFSGLDVTRVVLAVGRQESILVITDVIGTGRQIGRLLGYLQFAQIPLVMTIVDARAEPEDSLEAGKQHYPVLAAVQQPLTYYNNLPSDWLYTDIAQVDPATSTLILPGVPTEGALWRPLKNSVNPGTFGPIEQVENPFFDEVIAAHDACTVGHFENRGMHITYLFDIARIAQLASQEIAEAITIDVQERLRAINVALTVHGVVFPSYNPGVEPIAAALAVRFPEAAIIPVPVAAMGPRRHPLIASGLDTVIVLDDAVVSGDTLLTLYDAVEAAGAVYIFAYVLIKRGSESMLKRVFKVTKYGRAVTYARYLTDVQIPTYMARECPACHWRGDLERLREYVHIEGLREYLDAEIGRLAPIPVQALVVASTTSRHPDDRQAELRIRWQLERAKEEIGARHELARVVKSDPLDKAAALRLFRVLSRERYELLWQPQTRENIFYPSFRERVVEGCEALLTNVASLLPQDFEAVCVVLSTLDTVRFIRQFPELVLANSASRESVLRLIMVTLTGPAAEVEPDRYAVALHKAGELVKASSQCDSAIPELLENIRNHLQVRGRDFATSRQKRLDLFKALVGPAFHECGHYTQQLVWALSEEYVNARIVASTWGHLHQDIRRALTRWRAFRIGHPSDTPVIAGDLKAGRLALSAAECNALVESVCLSDEEVPSADPSIQDLRSRLEAINDAIYSADGFAKFLTIFQTNLKSSIQGALRQLTGSLDSSPIRVERYFPDEAAVVLGEGTEIALVFQNLIDNVVHSARATRLRIFVTINSSDSTATALLLDDGCGVSDTVPFGHGHQTIDRIVTAYGGSFSIRQLRPEEHGFAEGFRTVAAVRFALLPTIESSKSATEAYCD